MFFSPGGKNEIRVGFGQKVALGLRTIADSLSHDAAVAHRNLGLLQLVSGFLRVRLRMQESQQPLFLILLYQVQPGAIHPERGHKNTRNHHNNGRMLELDSAKEQRHKGQWHIRQSSS